VTSSQIYWAFFVPYDHTKCPKPAREASGRQRMCFSLYAASLIVMNGDPKMPIVAMGQEYFAKQTRRQELAAAQADTIEALPEDQIWLFRRAELSIQNIQLAAAAQNTGVITLNDFATFRNHRYRGLYTLAESIGAPNLYDTFLFYGIVQENVQLESI
jgi:hypothetical protein